MQSHKSYCFQLKRQFEKDTQPQMSENDNGVLNYNVPERDESTLTFKNR